MQKNLNIEKIIFKVVQIKFLAMHITNQKLSLDIFTVGNLLNIFMEHDLNILMIFGIKEKLIILAIAANIPQRLNTAFVLQGHILRSYEANGPSSPNQTEVSETVHGSSITDLQVTQSKLTFRCLTVTLTRDEPKAWHI